jgi:antitoxin ParD1/3/4
MFTSTAEFAMGASAGSDFPRTHGWAPNGNSLCGYTRASVKRALPFPLPMGASTQETCPTVLTWCGTNGILLPDQHFNNMAEGINVRFAGALQQFIRERVRGSGLYGSASEYIRDLVRRDFEREDARKWDSLRGELRAGAEADESQFVPLNAETVIRKAKSRRKSGGR